MRISCRIRSSVIACFLWIPCLVSVTSAAPVLQNDQIALRFDGAKRHGGGDRQ